MENTKKLIAGGLVAGSLMLGSAGLVLGAGLAKADPSDDAAAKWATCLTLDEYPTLSGVTGVITGLINEGYSGAKAGELVMLAAQTRCPEHTALLKRWADIVTSPSYNDGDGMSLR